MLRLSGELPILDGPSESACRSCEQKFNILSLGKRCHHCGYYYCRKCSDYRAAWPVGGMEGSVVSVDYQAKRVCCFCVRFLKITATGGMYLSAAREEFPVEFLLEYAIAYNIKMDRVVRPSPSTPKADLIRTITALSKDGCSCLPRENERYYRQHSVPNNIPQAQMGSLRPLSYRRPVIVTWGARDPWTRPSLDMSRSLEALSGRASVPSTSATLDGALRVISHHDHFPQRHTCPATGPTLDELLAMDPESIEALDIITLKSILETHQNLSNIDVQGFQKETLVRMVFVLVDDERAEREQQLGFAEILEGVQNLRLLEVHNSVVASGRGSFDVDSIEEGIDIAPGLGGGGLRGDWPGDGFITNPNPLFGSSTSNWSPQMTQALQPASGSLPPKGRGTAALKEPFTLTSPSNSNSTLCVVCQDEEANMAIITCGHMALCKGCSETIMKSTRQCPLCRTDIVTKSDIIRIFKA